MISPFVERINLKDLSSPEVSSGLGGVLDSPYGWEIPV